MDYSIIFYAIAVAVITFLSVLSGQRDSDYSLKTNRTCKGGKEMQGLKYVQNVETLEFTDSDTIEDVLIELGDVFHEVCINMPKTVKVKTSVNMQGVTNFVVRRLKSAVIGEVYTSTDARHDRVILVAKRKKEVEEEDDA